MSEHIDEPTTETEAPEAEPVETAEVEATAGIDYEAPEFREAVTLAARDEVSALVQAALQYEQGDGTEGEDDFDPFDRGALRDLIRKEAQALVEPMRPTVQAFEDQQNQARIDEWVEKIPSVTESQGLLGTDAPPDAASLAVQYMATGYLPDLEERYGRGERATQTALRMAADQFKTAVKAGHDAGYQARNAELKGLTGAREPVGRGPIEHVALSEEPADEMEAAARYIARRGND